MNISELMQQLQELMDEHGDVPVINLLDQAEIESVEFNDDDGVEAVVLE